MAFTYLGTLATDLDKLRFKIQDTISADPFFTDEELNALLSERGSVIGAAVAACDALIARFARKVNSSVGKLSKQSSDLMAHFQELRGQLFSELLASSTDGGAVSFIDDDREPAFTRSMHEMDEQSPNNEDN